MDKSKLRHAGNPIEVSRHSTAKLNKMKTDKYKGPIKREVVDDNIKMEVPDMAKIYFKNKVNTVEVCHVFAKEIWGQSSLLQHLKVHEGFQHQCNRCSYKTPTKKHLKGPINIPFRNNLWV